MSISSLALRTTATGSAVAAVEWRTPATVRAKVLEVSYISGAATAQSIGLGRPAAIGITPVNVAFQPDDPNEPASTMNGSLSWGTGPTVPSVYHRRWNGAATVGVGVCWTFPRGLIIPVSSSLVIFNITTTPVSDANCSLDE